MKYMNDNPSPHGVNPHRMGLVKTIQKASRSSEGTYIFTPPRNGKVSIRFHQDLTSEHVAEVDFDDGSIIFTDKKTHAVHVELGDLLHAEGWNVEFPDVRLPCPLCKGLGTVETSVEFPANTRTFTTACEFCTPRFW